MNNKAQRKMVKNKTKGKSEFQERWKETLRKDGIL